MEYNTQNSKLINGEYGRHIQKMIEYVVNIKNRDLRNEQAQAIIKTMAQMSSGAKDTEDFKHKLWDQMFVISDFKLDVDSPFEKPQESTVVAKPRRLTYPKNNIKFRPYGKLMENIIQNVADEKDNELKEEVVKNIAKQLKKQYLIWNRDSVSDDLIKEHLAILSNNKLSVSENFVFPSTKKMLNEIPPQILPNNNTKKNQSKTATQQQMAARKKKKKTQSNQNQQGKQNLQSK